MLTALKNVVSDFRFRRGIEKYHTRMGLQVGKAFTDFHRRCQAAYTPSDMDAGMKTAADQFATDGFATYWSERNQALAESMLRKIQACEASGEPIWDDDLVLKRDTWLEFPEVEELFRSGLTGFIESIYGSHLKVFYAKLYKAQRRADQPAGSQLWHSDGGPGTCINIMFYLSEGTRENGAMEIIGWQDSKNIFADERSAMRRLLPAAAGPDKAARRLQVREVVTGWYKDQIAKRGVAVSQPTGKPGLVFAFRNNNIHKGGYPEPGRTRYVVVFHVYPSLTPLNYEHYRAAGASKTGPLPADPGF